MPIHPVLEARGIPVAQVRNLSSRPWRPMHRMPQEVVLQSLQESRLLQSWNVVQAWQNNRYCCYVGERDTEWGLITHLAISRWWWREDCEERYPWSDLQRILVEVMGPDRTAISAHPAQAQLVENEDAHLWVLERGRELPFGLHLRQRRRPPAEERPRHRFVRWVRRFLPGRAA